MLTFYLVRHGTKEAVPFDPPLTQIGVKQAEITSNYLKETSFKAILTSPKLRTRQTAGIIAKPHLQEIFTENRLVERLEWEHNETFDNFIDEWNKTDIDRNYQPKKGKSSNYNGSQVNQLLEELFSKYKNGNILIVSHGGTIGDLLRHIFTEKEITHKVEPLSGAKFINILECSITTIQKNVDKYKLLKLGDISHLSIPLV
ncbi:phosphoglycerate mutase family protein [Patescibacteria group bacterium]|nr:phosphoglycerate mutase family protein [Patescibacteria group bacterium]